MDPVKIDGKLKEQTLREYITNKKWLTSWGKDYEQLAKWRDNIIIKPAEQRNIEYGRIRKSYNPWVHPIDREIKPTEIVATLSSEVVGQRAQYALEYPIEMYISPKHSIDPPDLPTKPETVIFIG